MDDQTKKHAKRERQYNGQPTVVPKEEISLTVKESCEEKQGENHDKAQRKYEEGLRKYEQQCAEIKAFGLELKVLFQKSQDNFEKQLSYISAGALALSIGFIKDIVQPIKDSSSKWMLLLGWGLLIFTLLLNLVSHIIAGKNARKGAKETEDIDKTYDPDRIDKRASQMDMINWTTVGTLACGIVLIVLYITFNAIL
ncbi:hypothetical protein [Flavisolibacter ginsengisoli]|jgi:hypothetical protein|uniref:Uncharacterized protein n=1 Tax=Flavisolibacter ginsengisoli DSM 18119 TaxID=1121884 RepID=A0A1M5EN05_9BACT|nr:hypothetical protein [Flavisolibacter ginsengisoli]SHF80556.1 hypothetical protein SAMN02745131_03567 [Flavisolibacter ginsengisoli DSM 18119]